MKKIMLLAILLLSVSFVRAQFELGVKGGFNTSHTFKEISSVEVGDNLLQNIDAQLKSGFQLGLLARISINKIYLQPEMLYSMMKKSYQFTIVDAVNGDIDGSGLVSISTIDFPVLAGYKLLESKMGNVRAYAGPKFRLNSGSTIKFENMTNNNSLDFVALKGKFDKSQIGAEMGVGVDFLMLTFDARMNLIKNIHTASWESQSGLNSNFLISIGWKIFKN